MGLCTRAHCEAAQEDLPFGGAGQTFGSVTFSVVLTEEEFNDLLVRAVRCAARGGVLTRMHACVWAQLYSRTRDATQKHADRVRLGPHMKPDGLWAL